MKRILRFNSDEANAAIDQLRGKISETLDKLEHIDDVTVDWYEYLKGKYGQHYPRKTAIRGFDNIQAAAVAEANEKLYINRKEGFVGTSLKKDEFICNCSLFDDIIIIYRDGRYKVTKVQEKIFVDKDVLYVNVFNRKDDRMTYNMIYQNGRAGAYYMKRFHITGVSRDNDYNLTPGASGTRICWFTANPNGEAEIVKVTLKPKNRLKTLTFDVDFAKLAIKGRGALGNLVTKNEVQRFSLKERGASTLGGRQVWFDFDVMRINYDGRGELLGEFHGNDQILVVLKNGEYYTTGFDIANHYEDASEVLRIEKFAAGTVWTAIVDDADQGFPYIKRFEFESSSKHQRFIGENEKSKLLFLTSKKSPVFRLVFADVSKVSTDIDAVEYIGVKSLKARGKRLTTLELDAIEEISPDEDAESVGLAEEDSELSQENAVVEDSMENPVSLSEDEINDSLNGQQRLF